MAFVYILQSEKTGKYYVGATEDITQRLEGHNRGNTTSTRPGRPWVLQFSQKYANIQKAKRIERKIKDLKRRDYIEKIIKDNRIELI